MSVLSGKKIAIFIEELYNEHEFWYPKFRLQEAGADVVVAGTESGKTYTSKSGVPAASDVSFSELHADEFDGLIIPGGYAPDVMRRSENARDFVRAMNKDGKLIAFICHAGWMVISAGVVKGREVTSFEAIKDDLVNAGAIWRDAAVVRDGNFISSRIPADLPAFMKAVIDFYKE